MSYDPVNGSSFIYVDSRDRVNPNDTSSDFSVRLTDTNMNENKSISIENISIPYSFFGINSTNNAFSLGSSVGTLQTVSITQGNYTSASFVVELKTQLDLLGIGTFTCSVSSLTGKLTISSTNPFVLRNDTVNYKYLGFPRAITTTSSTANAITSPNPIDLGIKYIDIITDLSLASSNTRNNNTDIFARIYINCNPFDTIFYDTSSFLFCKLLSNRLNSVHFRLIDDAGNLLNLNGLDWAITLEIADTPRKETILNKF